MSPQRVLRLVARGYLQEIAGRLQIDIKTVEAQKANAHEETGYEWPYRNRELRASAILAEEDGKRLEWSNLCKLDPPKIGLTAADS
jgi:hypothetical protein